MGVSLPVNPDAETRFFNGRPALILCWLTVLTIGILTLAAPSRSRAEVIFEDFFSGPGGNITNSISWIDVEGFGWESGASNSGVLSDGAGHVYNGLTNATATAGVQLVPIGPHGSTTATATLQLPAGSAESIDLGFCASNFFLTSPSSGSGPWIQVLGTGNINFYGGPALSNVVNISAAFTNTGSPVQVFLTYDAFTGTATIGTVMGGFTNIVMNQESVTNSSGAVTPQYFEIQFSTNLVAPASRWASAISVDWVPRPPPLLSLPMPVLHTNLVGAPGTNDLQLIESAFSSLTDSTNPTEVLFNAGATYMISNTSLTGMTPITLFHATNVVVNGNGCKIVITNPRIGFLDVNNCSNVIVENFSVDYNPLPFTQGTVTYNYYTGTNTPKETAFDFTVDPGYPAPTNANYVDSNAMSAGIRWGMVMDSSNLGRVAPGAYSQCFYTNVIQTNSNGAFKVYLQSAPQAATIQPGDRWCMISRWNSSIVFEAFESSQVTFLNNTSSAAAGETYLGLYSQLAAEVGDVIQFGPPPPGASARRFRTSNSDGGLFVDNRVGPWVQNCRFEGLTDDTANACVVPFQVTNAPAYPTNTFAVYEISMLNSAPNALLPSQAGVGDTFAFYNATNGVVFDRATVTAVSLPNITFDHPITNLVAGSYDTNTLLINESLNTSAVYLDNQFSNSAFHGIYCRANNILIAHNTLTGFGDNAIGGYPLFATTFLDFFAPTNAVILDNILSDGGFTEEGASNSIPSGQPDYALLCLLKSDLSSYHITNGLEISGIRILNNAFLNWRRAPLTLHNVTDVSVYGNYFGPPVTDDGLTSLSNDVIADLWASDYPNLRLSNNVNASTLSNTSAVKEDGTFTAIANAFQAPSPPELTAAVAASNVTVSWTSPAPGFVLQQATAAGSVNWQDSSNLPVLAGASNVVTLPVSLTNQFFRARQR